MITKKELIEKNKEMNKELIEKDQQIQQLKFKIDNLKSILKSKRGVDMDEVYSTRLKNKSLKSVNSSLRKQLKMLQEDYKNDTYKLKDELNFYKNKFEVKNVRGAGRKKKITLEQINTVKKLRIEGLSYSKISKKVGLSVGTIYNIAKSHI